jgi:hypothetical protein
MIRVDLMIEFIGPLYNLLQHCTNHYLRLDTLDFWAHYSSSWTVSLVKVKVTLRLTVSQSVSLGVEPHLGLMTKYLLRFDSYVLLFCGAHSLTRGRVWLLYMLLALASAVFLGSKSLGTRDHILLSVIVVFSLYSLLSDHAENIHCLATDVFCCCLFVAVGCVYWVVA